LDLDKFKVNEYLITKHHSALGLKRITTTKITLGQSCSYAALCVKECKMSLDQKTQILSGPIRSTMMGLTVPMVWGMASLFSFQLIDVYFISMLGTQALAAMGFSLPLTTLVMSFGLGLNIAVTAIVSKQIGSSSHQTTASLVGRCLIIVFCLALLISVMTWLLRDIVFDALGATKDLRPLTDAYLGWWLGGASLLMLFSCSNGCIRASGNTKLASRVLILSGLMNALFDPVFMFGFGPIPAFGIQGAAMATDLSWLIGAITIVWVLKKEGLLAWGETNFQSALQTTSQLLKLGVPSALSNALNPLFNAILIMMMAGFGETAIAAFGVGVRFEPFALILAFALAASLPPFVGQNWGAGHHDRIQRVWLWSSQFVVLSQAVIWVMLMVLNPGLRACSQMTKR
jgi:putative MATE family efflux protein